MENEEIRTDPTEEKRGEERVGRGQFEFLFSTRRSALVNSLNPTELPGNEHLRVHHLDLKSRAGSSLDDFGDLRTKGEEGGASVSKLEDGCRTRGER